MAEEQPGDRPGSTEIEAPGEEEGPDEEGSPEEGNGDAAPEGDVPGRRQRSFTSDWQALLTGMLIGAMMRVSGEFGVEVAVETDSDGNYLPWFIVTSASGNRAVVTVTAL